MIIHITATDSTENSIGKLKLLIILAGIYTMKAAGIRVYKTYLSPPLNMPSGYMVKLIKNSVVSCAIPSVLPL